MLQNIKLLLPFVGVKCRNVVQLAIQAVFRGGGAKCRAKKLLRKAINESHMGHLSQLSLIFSPNRLFQ